jgi:GTP-binding protein Era
VELVDYLVSVMPEGPWLYPTASATDRPLEFLAAEYVREQVFEQLDQEVPYHVAVKTDVFQKRGSKTYVEASIYTDSPSSKKILVGKEGARVKSIGMAARKRIEDLVEGPVYLQLQVRVKEDWQEDERFLEDLGL